MDRPYKITVKQKQGPIPKKDLNPVYNITKEEKIVYGVSLTQVHTKRKPIINEIKVPIIPVPFVTPVTVVNAKDLPPNKDEVLKVGKQDANTKKE
jgi:hypothetical protein